MALSRAEKGGNSPVATEADVRYAYRLLLGREPDPGGLRHHVDWMRANNASAGELAQQFIASQEYRARALSDAELVRVDMSAYAVFPRRGDRLIGSHIIQGESYEPHVCERFDKVLNPGSWVLDVGANIGLYTMRAAAGVGPEGKVIAVEPLPQNHKSLYEGIKQNGFANVCVLPFAASDSSGLISAICAPDSSNGIVGVHGSAASGESCVPTWRLDDVLEYLPRLDVVKIDIEGHEPAAWRGMSALMLRNRPHVFTEFSPVAMRNVGQDASEYLDMLLALRQRLLVLHRDVAAVECEDAAAVMAEWEAANHRFGLNGEMHLDLYIEASK